MYPINLMFQSVPRVRALLAICFGGLGKVLGRLWDNFKRFWRGFWDVLGGSCWRMFGRFRGGFWARGWDICRTCLGGWGTLLGRSKIVVRTCAGGKYIKHNSNT